MNGPGSGGQGLHRSGRARGRRGIVQAGHGRSLTDPADGNVPKLDPRQGASGATGVNIPHVHIPCSGTTKAFSRLWAPTDNAVLHGLRSADRPLQERCAHCPFRDLGGGFRVRAWQRHGDPWAEDPGCHLSDEETLDPAVAA